MKTFKELSELVNEMKKKSIIIDWVNDDKGSFEINTKTDNEYYEIEFDKDICDNNEIVGYKFFRLKNNKRIVKYEKSNDPLTVMYTIKKSVEQYLDKNEPEIFAFIGDNKEPQRVKKYKLYTKTLSKKFGYYHEEYEYDGNTIFLLCKNKDCIESKCVQNTLNKFTN